MHCPVLSRLDSLFLNDVTCVEETIQRACAALTSLKFFRAHSDKWVDALGTEPLLCPQLKSLSILVVKEALYGVLERRKAQGMPVSLLRYEYALLNTAEKNRLLQYVRQVERHPCVDPDPEILDDSDEEEEEEEDIDMSRYAYLPKRNVLAPRRASGRLLTRYSELGRILRDNMF